MTTAPTSPWNIPLFGVGDTIGPLASVFNSQSNALNSALNSVQTTAFTFQTTLANLNLPANAGTKVGQHATVNADSTAANNGDYTWNGTAWVPVDSGWVALTWQNGWADFSTGYPPLAARRKNGMLYLSGMGKGGTATPGILLATLPVGMRIGRQEVISTIGSGGACSLEIFTDGSIKTGPSGVYATWTSLNTSFVQEG